MMQRPIRPSEVAEYKSRVIPGFVFEAFNKHIALDFVDPTTPVTVYQDDVCKSIRHLGKIPDGQSIDTKWLNIETAYEAEGWEVSYDKPAYNENYRAKFEFLVKK